MILKKQFIYPALLSLLLVGMLFGYQNCSKSKKLQLDIQNSSQYVVTSSVRAEDLEIIFKDLLAQEKSERIAADAALEVKVNELNNDLQNYKNQTNAAITALEDKSRALEVSMNSTNGDLVTRINQAEAATKALENKTEVNLYNLEISLKDQLAKSTENLRTEILRNTEFVMENKAQTEEQRKLIAEQSDALLKLVQSFEEYKTLVSVTYATKKELNDLKALYDVINTTVKNLNIKVDYNAAQVAEKLGALSIELNTKITNLDARLTQQGKDIQLIRSDLKLAISEYKTEIQNQKELMIKLIAESKTQLTNIINLNNVEIRDQIFNQINKKSLALSLYVKKAVSQLAAAIAQLDKKITDQKNLSAAERQKLKDEIIALRTEMSEAIANEQSARNELADEVFALTERVQRLELDALEIRQMAEANAQIVIKLSAEFESEKQKTADKFQVLKMDVDAKIVALRNEFGEKLEAVAKKSEELVRDLGEDVRTQFVKVTTDIALLNNRVTQLEAALRQLIETYQTDRSKLVNLETGILNQKNTIQPHLINTINALSAVQMRFIQVLAPDEKNKDFYDTDMKELMASCGGNSMASFANVMGLDSFQLLSLEYTRLMALGIRSGDAKNDSIFYSYGAMDERNTLARSLSLALTRHTALAGDADCLERSQKWATSILLSDSRFSELAKKLAVDEELERRVGVLYASFAEVKAPSEKLQKIIDDALSGLPKKIIAYEVISAQVSLDLITDAWGSMLLTERMRNFTEIEKMQTGQSELAADMKAGFNKLRAELAAFKTTTNTRLANLETQQGKLTTALKKALDVIITLANRSNYADLVLMTRAAGEAIDYIPQIISNWTPQITAAQHFFSGSASLKNKTDACTGATILPTAGAAMEYRSGVMNPCWVNFRNIPLNNWQNESKTIWVRVFGAANALNFKVNPDKQLEHKAAFANYNFERLFDFRNITANDPALKMTGVYSKAVFDIKTPDLFDYYVQNIRNYGGVTVSITAIRKEGSSQITGNTLDYTMRIYSPLILDFIREGQPTTISKDLSGVVFDHLGKGQSVATGWVSGSEAAFLVRGHMADFSSRKINGSDLFGEGTRLPDGSLAKDGFEALRQFDENKDGFIDVQDSIYRELSVWFDYNNNGELEPGEMERLKEKGVVKMPLGYVQIPMERALNNGNDIRYKSFALSKDQSVVANVYDVFFSTDHIQYR